MLYSCTVIALQHRSSQLVPPSTDLVGPLVGDVASLSISLQFTLAITIAYSLVVLICQSVVLLVLLFRLLLQGVKVPSTLVAGVKFPLKLRDPLAHLVGLAVGSGLLGGLLLQRGEGLLDVDEVENDVEDAGKDEGEEEGRAGEVH
jgi:hypothetical protein